MNHDWIASGRARLNSIMYVGVHSQRILNEGLFLCARFVRGLDTRARPDFFRWGEGYDQSTKSLERES